MATTKGIVTKKENTASEPQTLASLLGSTKIKKRLDEVLGQKAPGFISSVISIVKNNHSLANVDPKTVVGAAMQAAVLDLPVEQNLGYAYIIPFKREAQFQIGYKGFIQLAIRSGQYRKLTTNKVFEGEIVAYDKFNDEITRGEAISDKVIGYIAYLRLNNGFEKYYYMTVDEIKEHAKAYSQSFRQGKGVWIDNFDVMAEKTVLKLLLKKYGVVSITMQRAIDLDQAVIKENGEEQEVHYADNELEVDSAFEAPVNDKPVTEIIVDDVKEVKDKEETLIDDFDDDELFK